jgi:predicted esterase
MGSLKNAQRCPDLVNRAITASIDDTYLVAHGLHQGARVRTRLIPIVVLVGCCLVLFACSHADHANDQPADAPVSHPDTKLPDAPGIDATQYRYLCDAPIPSGSPLPTNPNLPAAGCPVLAAGHNDLVSGGNAREFLFVVPASFSPEEHLPVLFLWHWIGGSAQSFLDRGEIQAAADEQRFIAVIPVAKGATVFGLNLNTRWPFDITQSQARMDEEFQFFDDMLACVEAQYHINTSCVSTVGVSAGALFTDQLAQARSNRLASFISLSGGVNDTIIKPWAGTGAHKLPGIVLWGGDGPPSMDGNKDILGCLGLGMDFSVASRDMEQGLVADGHFFVECRHNCGHVEPPLDTPPGESKYAAMWEFAMNHPYWLAAGHSPYLDHGLPPAMPAWCAVGQGNSTPRSGGGCPMAENPCAF